MARKKAKVLEYNALFTSEERGGYSVYVPELPGCISQGETFEEAKENIKEAIKLFFSPPLSRVWLSLSCILL